MDESSLSQFEGLCERLFVPQSMEDQRNAQTALAVFETDPSRTAQLKFVLDTSTNLYAQHFAAQCLLRLTTRAWTSFSLKTRVDIRNYLLHTLFERGPDLPHHLSDSLIMLLARITKLGWFDDPADEDGARGKMKALGGAVSELALGGALPADGASGSSADSDLSASLNVHRKTPAQVASFFRPDSPVHSEIGLRILVALVTEVGSASPAHTLTQHRKTSTSFRDLALLRIFKLALNTLRAINSGTVSAAEQDAQDSLRGRALRLAHLCVTFDFVGTQPTESTEDDGTLKIPSEWRSLFESRSSPQATSLLDLFWDLFSKSENAEHRAKSMEILVDLASVRRSLFTEDESRDAYLARIMNGITDVLRTRRGMEDENCFHQFCRLLARLKGNYQLSQIVNAEGYGDWIRLVADFSIESLRQWSQSSNSLFYILTLWSRLVAAIPYLLSNSPTALEEFAPTILESYVKSRLDTVQMHLEEGDDPFGEDEDEGVIFEQLDTLPYLGRLRYDRTSQFLAGHFDPLVRQYETLIKGPPSDQLQVVEGRLAWLVYVIGAIVAEPSCSIVASSLAAASASTGGVTPADMHPQLDAELSARIIRLLHLHDNHLPPPIFTKSKERLNTALLSFLQHFRKVYVGDGSVSAVAMFERLAELSGVDGSAVALTIMVQKILSDLEHFAEYSTVVERVVQLFHDLAAGYSSVRLMIKLPTIRQILANHSSSSFRWLDVPDNSPSRPLWYAALAKFLHLTDDASLRAQFQAPFSAVCRELLACDTPASLAQSTPATALYRLCLDQRGFLDGTYNRKSYEQWFDWMYPRYAEVLERGAEVFAGEPRLVGALLKLMVEVTQNKSGRISFDCSSANGILLFKWASKIVTNYGSQAVGVSVSTLADPYRQKYKGIIHCLSILVNGLQGGYCNFGVFDLYGDSALNDAVLMCLRLVLSIDLQHVLAYPKLAKSTFSFLERLFDHHVPLLLKSLAALDEHRDREGSADTAGGDGDDRPYMARVLVALREGLRYPEASVSTQCCTALDHLASYAVRLEEKANTLRADAEAGDAAAGDALRSMDQEVTLMRGLVSRHQVELSTTLGSLLDYAILEDIPNSWSASRCVFSLALLTPDAFTRWRDAVIERQPVENQQRLVTAFETLMDGVEPNLESKTRDRFTNHMGVFRTDIKSFVAIDAVV